MLNTIKFIKDYIVNSGKLLYLKYGYIISSIKLGLENRTLGR